MFRIGLGQDSHFFMKRAIKPLIFGGIKINDNSGLEGNSDGDVVIHSLCNALSSAIGGNSISTWADEMCLKKGITDSQKYLKHILREVIQKKYQIENVSISVEAKQPYLSLDIINEIKKNLAQLLLLRVDQIGITFTSGKGLTAFGRGKGIQVLTVVLIKKND